MKNFDVLVEFWSAQDWPKEARLVDSYFIDWNNPKEVREFARKANEWLRAKKGNSVTTISCF